MLRSNSLLLLLRIFKVALLFICQGSKRLHIVSAEICFAHFSLILSNRRCISATAYLEYHMLFALSTTFLNYFLLLVEVCFSHFIYLSNESEYITLISLCQHLFFIFLNILNNLFLNYSNGLKQPLHWCILPKHPHC